MKLDLKLRGIKKYYLNQKGITLIALVVTIVVLLILAGVSINALFGNNGIISRAKDTKKVTNLSSLKDEIGIVIQSRNINKMAGLPAGSFKEELENEGYLKKKNKSITFYINGFSYTTTKGTTWCEYAKKINSNINCLDNTYFNQGTKMNLNYNYICSDNECSLENTVKNNDEIKPINYYNSQNVK